MAKQIRPRTSLQFQRHLDRLIRVGRKSRLGPAKVAVDRLLVQALRKLGGDEAIERLEDGARKMRVAPPKAKKAA